MRKRFRMAALCVALGFAPLCVAQDAESAPVDLAECPVNMANNFWPGLLIPRADITASEPGSRIIMDYELNKGAADAMFAFTSNYGKTNLPGFEGTIQDNPTDAPDRYLLPISENGTYTYTITEETISKLNDKDFHGWDGNVRIVGKGFTITKLVLAAPDGDVSGVEEILTPSIDENAPVEFYNLQGVKVSNPSNGIFIRRQGNKTSKISVK